MDKVRGDNGRFVKGHANVGGGAPIGSRNSPETEFKKGLVPWNKTAGHYLTCAHCKKEFRVANWEMKSRGGDGRKFCSRECTHSGADYKATFQSGDKHPAWIDGNAGNGYTKEFNQRLKTRIKQRDNFTCQLCGTTEEQQKQKIGRGLVVNHIDFDKKNCDENNLNTLCVGCNSRINWNRRHWTAVFQNRVGR